MRWIGVDRACYGWLLTPRRTMTKTGLFGLRYAVDNECFTLGDQFDGDRFLRALGRVRDVHGARGCLFVVAPDVVGDAVGTLERFDRWESKIRALGFPVALAAQDGLEAWDVPWGRIDALFVGGSTEWKLGVGAAGLCREAQARGKWVHFGRVNSVRRASRLWVVPDSVDGTAWAKHPGRYALEWARWVASGKPRFAGHLI
jgi:hypothetical protein